MVLTVNFFGTKYLVHEVLDYFVSDEQEREALVNALAFDSAGYYGQTQTIRVILSEVKVIDLNPINFLR